ncbi:DUF2274 domain-containing protein [Pseudomonas sp. 8O]|uniref:DUF2274 domain-containing protein n=1 Tax=Pseudomonas sp. 8O TaxID=2653165 RepID=UPI0012F2057C|nr:DUF2274 domain-containing protein [Pseudomonas sp. 8O]VXC35547.1 conserved hypothetical protein [Pseudomonas sp. 8O]
MSMTKLRLGPSPKTENLKLTFTWPAILKADLERYAALHSQTYGEKVDALTLIPHMLEAFMARDRVFRRANTESSS